MGCDEIKVLLDFKREESGRVLRVRALSVPQSEQFTEGVKYRFHYGTTDGETIVRYDNSHGSHERHVGDTTEEIEFPDGELETLYRRFVADIESVSTENIE